jgi:1,2-diacylglycerol 3-alpha-glucosyltransferase/glucuronosyltransferase
MRILIATDAWPPQINGVCRTLLAVADRAERLGNELIFLTPDQFPSVPLPTYPEIPFAMPNLRVIGDRIADAHPDAIHIATEGPIGHVVRHHCLRSGIRFSTSFLTRLPKYISARLPVLPESWAWSWLRWFHFPATAVMTGTPAFVDELQKRGFRNVKLWPPGVDSELFRPRPSLLSIPWPRPIFLYVGRVAIDKNLPAFLSMELPGSKIIVGDGPARLSLMRQFQKANFLGVKEGEKLAEMYAAADVFVLPSRTEISPLVLLEALASGLPIAAFPVMGPADMLDAQCAALEDDLQAACIKALALPRNSCREIALPMTWEASASAFLANLSRLE